MAAYITGGLNFGIENAFIAKGVEAATTNLIVGVVEGTITGEFDLDQVLRGAILAGVSTSISSYLSESIDFGAGLSDQSPFLNDVRGTFAPAAIVDRAGDRVISHVVTNVVHGQDPFAGLDQLGRTNSGATAWTKSQPPRKLHECLNNPRALQVHSVDIDRSEKFPNGKTVKHYAFNDEAVEGLIAFRPHYSGMHNPNGQGQVLVNEEFKDAWLEAGLTGIAFKPA